MTIERSYLDRDMVLARIDAACAKSATTRDIARVLLELRERIDALPVVTEIRGDVVSEEQRVRD